MSDQLLMSPALTPTVQVRQPPKVPPMFWAKSMASTVPIT